MCLARLSQQDIFNGSATGWMDNYQQAYQKELQYTPCTRVSSCPVPYLHCPGKSCNRRFHEVMSLRSAPVSNPISFAKDWILSAVYGLAQPNLVPSSLSYLISASRDQLFLCFKGSVVFHQEGNVMLNHSFNIYRLSLW